MNFSSPTKCTWYNQGQVPFFSRLKHHLEIRGIKGIEKFIGKKVIDKGGRTWPRNIGEGITFKPLEYQKFLGEVTRSGNFVEDNPRTLVGSMALSETIGRGFRSPGSPSLHIAIASHRVNIHLDTTGFLHTQDGHSFYGPDCLQHIANDLYMAKWLHWRHFKINAVLPNTNNGLSKIGFNLSWEKVHPKEKWRMKLALDLNIPLDKMAREKIGKKQMPYYFGLSFKGTFK